MIPWDLDTILCKYAPADSDIHTFCGTPDNHLEPNKLMQLMFLNPAWKKEFEDDLVAIRDDAYSRLSDRVDYVCAQIRDAVAADPNKVNKDIAAFDADCADIKQRIASRTTYIKQVLGR